MTASSPTTLHGRLEILLGGDLMANPNRDTTAGAAFIDLRALAKAQGRNVADLAT